MAIDVVLNIQTVPTPFSRMFDMLLKFLHMFTYQTRKKNVSVTNYNTRKKSSKKKKKKTNIQNKLQLSVLFERFTFIHFMQLVA